MGYLNNLTEVRKTIIGAINCIVDELPDGENSKCIGFLLVAELMNEEGGRHLHVASGTADGDYLIPVIGAAYVEAAACAYEDDE